MKLTILAFRAWIMLQVTHFEIKRNGFQAVVSNSRSLRPIQVEVDDILRACRLAERFSPWSNCLRRCIVFAALLRAGGLDPKVEQGARIDPSGKIQMHAWVTLNGCVVGDEQTVVSSYTAVDLRSTD